MKISSNAWHYKFQAFFFRNDEPRTLCNYVNRLLVSVLETLVLLCVSPAILAVAAIIGMCVILPTIALEKFYSTKVGKVVGWYDGYILTGAALIFWTWVTVSLFNNAGTIHNHWTNLGMSMFVGAMCLIFVAIIVVKNWYSESGIQITFGPDAETIPRESGVLLSWVKAKKEKVCPLIEIVDD